MQDTKDSKSPVNNNDLCFIRTLRRPISSAIPNDRNDETDFI
jgi:hypothetical protein